MTIYLVVVKDRHTDDFYEAFTNRSAAIDCAKDTADEYGYERSDEEREEDKSLLEVGDYCFVQTTSCEGDCVEVHEIEVEND